jgi:hypothetical protein
LQNLLFLAALAASAPAAHQRPAAAASSAAAESDAECLTLSLIAASVVKDDAEKMKVAVAESWYFLGRLDSRASSPDLKLLLPPIANRLEKDPHVKELGQQCDKLFTGRGADLRSLGQQSSATKP